MFVACCSHKSGFDDRCSFLASAREDRFGTRYTCHRCGILSASSAASSSTAQSRHSSLVEEIGQGQYTILRREPSEIVVFILK